MAFKTLFIAHAPDANRERHRSVIDTGMYQLFTVVVKNQEEAVEVSSDFIKREHIESILLCPGFKHSDVAEIAKTVGSNAAVAVVRGDGPSNKVSQEALQREGYFTKKGKD